MVYNNIVVNCRYGLSLVASPAPDTANLLYGYNSHYGDSALVTDGFYPVGSLTVPQTSDLPNPILYLPAGFIPGIAYDGTNMIGINAPSFDNFILPNPNFREIDYVTGYDFHLQGNSPDFGKGYTGFQPMAVVPLDPDYGATNIQEPNADLGCYSSNGNGNLH